MWNQGALVRMLRQHLDLVQQEHLLGAIGRRRRGPVRQNPPERLMHGLSHRGLSSLRGARTRR
jgi:hypothetical protein